MPKWGADGGHSGAGRLFFLLKILTNKKRLVFLEIQVQQHFTFNNKKIK